MFEKTAAITGPMPHKFSFRNNEEHPACFKIKDSLRNQILLHYGLGVRRFLSGACIGVEMWAGEIVLSLMGEYPDIELYCIIPFEEQATKWTERQRDRYFAMLEKCTKSVQLNSRYYHGCYRDRNLFLAKNSKYLIAVYDKYSMHHVGTGQTVFMAVSMGRLVSCIHPQTCEISIEVYFP